MECKAKTFANISQRAISSYRKALANYNFVALEGEIGAGEQSQRDLYAFFNALYDHLFEQPDLFGLPTAPDAAIMENETNEKDKKQAVKKLLDKPRGMIAAGLDFLILTGIQGTSEQGVLIVDDYPGLIKQSRVGKKFMIGLEKTGLVISQAKSTGVIENRSFPEMMPALQALAKACAAYDSAQVGRFLFAGCDFRALQGYQPQAADLYRVFEGEDYARAAELHTYFSDRHYKTEIGIGGTFAWTVKYQGDRKVKASPLFQVEYEERYAHSQRMQIKCASTARIAELLPKQSALLQEDFQRRVNECRGDECGWCRNNKTLGPSVLEFGGEFRTVCWYTNPDIRVFDEHTVELIEQYERMHAGLAPEK
jgi:hypothetical protein